MTEIIVAIESSLTIEHKNQKVIKMNTQKNVDNKRYNSLIISIVLFLSLIVALLAFTFYTSNLLERNTALINQTNRVANSAQAVILDLSNLERGAGEDINSLYMQKNFEKLANDATFISASLDAMQQGGKITSANGQVYSLPNLDAGSQEKINKANSQWQLLEPKLQTYLKDADNILVDSSNDLFEAIRQSNISGATINESLALVSDEIFANAERQASTIRIIQVLGVIAISAYFLTFIFFFVRRLRETDAAAVAAKRETQEIMETVDTGLFLLDKDLSIGQQYSRALTKIIGTDSLAGNNLTDVLRGRISDKDLTTTRQFIEQLYNPRVKEKLVDSLNPLHKVMLQNSSTDKGSGSRFLDFKFSRVYEDKNIARILVNVNDVSDAVYLEQRLEKEREQNNMQVEMLTTILNVKPKIINEFIINTKTRIDKINSILKNPGSSQFELERKLNAIYRDMHSLKGESSSLKLHSFTKIASEAEDKLHVLQNQGQLSGNDFLPLAVHLDELFSLSNTIALLGERINQTSLLDIESATENLSTMSDEMPIVSQATDDEEGDYIDLDDEADSTRFSYYQNFAQDIAVRQGKQVQLASDSLAHIDIPDTLQQAVNEISIQLLRNAIVHGIETPNTRQIAGKSETGKVELEMQNNDQDFIVVLQDDGQGIDYENVRARLVSIGRFSEEDAKQLTRNQLLNQLFSSGFSTKEDADEDGGRGVGLDIIKAQVKKYNGTLNVTSEFGTMTRFVITLPKAS